MSTNQIPSQIKTSTLGSSISIPITKGCLNLGTWQGIYLGEHRDYGCSRTLIATIQGQKRKTHCICKRSITASHSRKSLFYWLEII
ncbi:YjbQ family protein [Endozoicomonas sp. G2_1]|uniref:YjbQ family protein n=1 Tax=Endozoicomonas sp. G2_1 TaxID=2821091 RepID=UPI0032B00777